MSRNIRIRIERDSPVPIYRQIAESIRQRIEAGLLPSGYKLPPSRRLAERLGVARISVVNAYAELQSEGLVRAYPARGTFVTGKRAGSRKGAAPDLIGGSTTWRALHRLAHRQGVIDLSGGAPSPEFLPVNAIRHAVNAVLERDGAIALDYEPTEGYFPLRRAVRDHVASLGIECRPDDVLITGGCQQALDLAVQALVGEGETILTTNPTYLGLLDIARARRIRLIGLPCDDEGLVVEGLEDAIEEWEPRLIAITPTFHNPTGTVMSLPRRRFLLEVAATYGVPILEDGVYHELHYERVPPPPLRTLSDKVLYASGFSKILLPGTRIGYLIAGGEWHDRLVQVKRAADICSPGLNQRGLHFYLADGALPGHLSRLREALRARRDLAVGELREHLPGARFTVPQGGIYIWAELPPGPTAAELYATAVEHGVAFAIGTLFHTDGSGERYMRLNFAAVPERELAVGIRRLGQAWRELGEDMDKSRHPAPIL